MISRMLSTLARVGAPLLCLAGAPWPTAQAAPPACPAPVKLAVLPEPAVASRPNGAITTVYDLKTVKIHAYTAPKPALRTSTYVIEGPARLVVIEPQFMNSMAKDFRAYVDGLGKPIERVLVTDRDPDHYFGLAAAFSDVPAYALADVIGIIEKGGQALLEERRKIFGDEMPQKQVVPSHVLKTGRATIDCVRYRFEASRDDEGNRQLVVRLPDYGVIATGDIAANQVHLVPGPTTEQRLKTFAKAAKSYTLVLPSNGVPTDGALFADNLAYLASVGKNLKEAGNADDYQKRMVQAYPDYANDIYFNFYVPGYFAKKH